MPKECAFLFSAIGNVFVFIFVGKRFSIEFWSVFNWIRGFRIVDTLDSWIWNQFASLISLRKWIFSSEKIMKQTLFQYKFTSFSTCAINWTTNLLWATKKNGKTTTAKNGPRRIGFSWKSRIPQSTAVFNPRKTRCCCNIQSCNVKMASAWVDCRRMFYAHAWEREVLNEILS